MNALAVRQGTPEWLAARRSLVTATDIPVLLGLSPYKCEADLADEKAGAEQPPATLRMRAGLILQDLIGEAYTEQTGKALRRFRGLSFHPTIEWAAASPDFRVVGERRLVEAKRSASRSRFADGLPQDVEAQVAWQLGVTGYPAADVAVLLADDELVRFEVEADPDLFADLVTVAEDFRRRLEAGGPFARDTSRIRRDHPADDGTELIADADVIEAAHALAGARSQIAALEATEEALKAAIQARMGPAAVLIGPDFRATWKRTKDREETDWKSLAQGLLRTVPETEREPLVGIHTSVRSGFRPFRLVMGDKDND
jgi:putative phage-type endonuclease